MHPDDVRQFFAQARDSHGDPVDGVPVVFIRNARAPLVFEPDADGGAQSVTAFTSDRIVAGVRAGGVTGATVRIALAATAMQTQIFAVAPSGAPDAGVPGPVAQFDIDIVAAEPGVTDSGADAATEGGK